MIVKIFSWISNADYLSYAVKTTSQSDFQVLSYIFSKPLSRHDFVPKFKLRRLHLISHYFVCKSWLRRKIQSSIKTLNYFMHRQCFIVLNCLKTSAVGKLTLQPTMHTKKHLKRSWQNQIMLTPMMLLLELLFSFTFDLHDTTFAVVTVWMFTYADYLGMLSVGTAAFECISMYRWTHRKISV